MLKLLLNIGSPNLPYETSCLFLRHLESTFNPIFSEHSPNIFNLSSVNIVAPRNAFK